MLKPQFSGDNEPAPSYEDAVKSAAPSNYTSEKDSKPAHVKFGETKARCIQTVMAEHLEPALSAQVSDGVSSKTYILLHSDITAELMNISYYQIVGITALSNINIIKLHGEENRAGFWLQSHVVQALTTALKDWLTSSGFRTEDDPTSTQSRQASTVARGVQHAPRSFWSRKNVSLPGPEHDPTASTKHWKAGWRSDEENAAALAPLGSQQARVNGKIKELSFRSESEMGLLLTKTVPVVWLEVEFGS